MLYQKDAHQYRKQMRRARKLQRLRGIFLLITSIGLMFYAIPCFAASIWDDDSYRPVTTSTTFASEIRDTVYVDPVQEQPQEEQGEGVAIVAERKDMKDLTVAETTGPGLVTDDNAVQAAKRRAEAVSVATAEKFAQSQDTIVKEKVAADLSGSLILAVFALVLSVICSIFGAKSLLDVRKIRTSQISKRYSFALRAS